MSKIEFDYVDSHKSEYWYKCKDCGATDWFAHYGRPQDLNQCLPTCQRSDKFEFDALVFIGRFQPLHLGHKAIIDAALKRAKEVIVVVGSSFAARDIRNPFTFEERKRMIASVYPDECWSAPSAPSRLKVVPVGDYPYDDNKWVAAVQNVVHGAISWSADPVRIGLIGHEKDGTSFYLKIFPTWASVSVPNVDGINATDIRTKMLNAEWNKELFDYIMPDSAVKIVDDILWDKEEMEPTIVGTQLFTEYRMIKKYKEAWKAAPFPPTFMTVDAVVVQSGHVLLVKRGDMPGKGLWALPGGFLNQDEKMLDGAIRELKEETKIKVPVPVLKGSIKDSKTFDAPNRSARGRTITQAFYIDLGFDEKLPKVKGSDDAEKAFWVPLNEVIAQRDMFFEDHFHIISYFTKVG
jgi:bifunctional NMN adenylyltransferase/nudix hydrolase